MTDQRIEKWTRWISGRIKDHVRAAPGRSSGWRVTVLDPPLPLVPFRLAFRLWPTHTGGGPERGVPCNHQRLEPVLALDVGHGGNGDWKIEVEL